MYANFTLGVFWTLGLFWQRLVQLKVRFRSKMFAACSFDLFLGDGFMTSAIMPEVFPPNSEVFPFTPTGPDAYRPSSALFNPPCQSWTEVFPVSSPLFPRGVQHNLGFPTSLEAFPTRAEMFPSSSRLFPPRPDSFRYNLALCSTAELLTSSTETITIRTEEFPLSNASRQSPALCSTAALLIAGAGTSPTRADVFPLSAALFPTRQPFRPSSVLVDSSEVLPKRFELFPDELTLFSMRSLSSALPYVAPVRSSWAPSDSEAFLSSESVSSKESSSSDSPEALTNFSTVPNSELCASQGGWPLYLRFPGKFF